MIKIKNLLGDSYVQEDILILNKIAEEEIAINQAPRTHNASEPKMSHKNYHISDVIDQMKK